MTQPINPAELLGNGVIEVRALVKDKWNTICSGYFDNPQAAYSAAMQFDGKADVYLTINDLDPALLSRKNGGQIQNAGKGETSNDGNVTRRRWLLLDADPVRASGVSSTDKEKAEALAVLERVRQYLSGRFWPEPVICDSGNGYHLIYRIDLPNDNDSTDLVKGVLRGLSARFSNERVKLDEAVFNASRITKFYGVMTRKGKSTPERPHRRSRVVYVPPDLVPVAAELLRAEAPKEEPKAVAHPAGAFRLDDWLSEHGVRVKRTEQTPDGGTRYILADGCPFNPEHTGKDAVLYRYPNGAIGFKCFHDSCAGKGWKEFREHFDPRLTARDAFGRTENNMPKKAGTPARLETISAAELQKKNLPPLKWIVLALLPQGLALLVSPPKFGKSWWVLDLCLSVASGNPFLNRPTQKGECLYLALEDSLRRLKDRMQKVLNGAPAPEGFHYAVKAGIIGQGLIEQLEEHLKLHPKTSLIVIDTFQKVRGEGSKTDTAYGNDYKEVGALKAFADDHGICVLLVHHLRKMGDPSDVFNRISGTNGIGGAADTMMALVREKREDVNTTLSITGRDIDSRDDVIYFNKEAFRWQMLGTLEERAELARRAAYDNDPIVRTIRLLVNDAPEGWDGTAQEILTAVTDRLDIFPEDTTRSLGKKIRQLAPQLFKFDEIVYREPTSRAGGKRKHHFHKSGMRPQIQGYLEYMEDQAEIP